MISRITVRWRWLRRVINRTYLSARLLGVKRATGEADLPGLVMLQVDGLARTQLERAIARGNLPFVSRLLRREHFSLESFYSGIPSTTPAVQGEVFYGIRAAVPGFQFLHRETATVMRMYEADSAAAIERHLKESSEPLLQDGCSYSNIYRAGARHSRYCSEDLAADELIKHLNPLKFLIIAVVYLPRLIRIAGLAAIELFLALSDAFKGLHERKHLAKELLFVPTRVVVCLLLREMVRFRILVDIERGAQVIHGNFLGYDEQSHRRGPDSDFAHWTLKGIDRAIRDIFRAASHSNFRDYEVVVYSDHGQEHTIPYYRKFGRSLHEGIIAALAEGPLADHEVWTKPMPETVGNAIGQVRHLFGRNGNGHAAIGAPDPESQVVVTALGPLGHLYFPRSLEEPEREEVAISLVRNAGIPLVLFKRADGTVRAINRRMAGVLPRDRARILGSAHPFLDEVAEDLVALCGHPDAGDIIISGWDPEDEPLTFPMENGAHCGPGYEETRGFLLLPDRIRRWHQSRLPGTRKRVRGEELRKIALHFLGRDGTREERVREYMRREPGLPLRVMTYNIHSCIGLDGKVRPERVARVINHLDPDIVAVQEVDAHRPRSRGDDQAHVIAEHLRMTHVFQAMYEEAKERYGIAIFSRYPFQLVKAGNLTEAAPRGSREARGAIWVHVEPDCGQGFHFINTHFGLGHRERKQQADVLMGEDWLGGIPASDPLVLCGDFNSGPRSAVIRRIEERLRDAQTLPPGHRPLATFSSIRPMLRIDHVFVSHHFSASTVHRPGSPTASIASDHLPLCAELTLR